MSGETHTSAEGVEALQTLLNTLLGVYVNRNEHTAGVEWCVEALRQAEPGMTAQQAERTLEDARKAAERYQAALKDLTEAEQRGVSPDEWLCERMMHSHGGMSDTEFGKALRRMRLGLMRQCVQLAGGDASNINLPEPVSWTEFSLRAEIRALAKTARSVAQEALACASQSVDGERRSDKQLNGAVRRILSQPNAATQEEIQILLTAAAKAAQDKHLLPEMPTEGLAGIVGIAIQCLEAVQDMATGRLSLMEAMARVGQGVGAALSMLGSESVLEAIRHGVEIIEPYVPILMIVLEVLLSCVAPPAVAAVVPVLLKAAQGILQELLKDGHRVEGGMVLAEPERRYS